MTGKADTLTVRLTREHIPDVAAIEKVCFSVPWSEQSLYRLVDEKGAVGYAVTVDGRVVAYGGMLSVCDEGQVTNIAVLPEYRGRGFGRAVTEALISYAKEQGIAKIFLEVRCSNEVAQNLYRSLGFEKIGEYKRFYHLPTENAVSMALEL